MFSSAISKIWFVGLILFATTPFLISRTSTANDHTPAALETSVGAPVEKQIQEIKGDDRDPAAVSEALAK